MSKYFVTFTGHIDELRRPENFPNKIFIKKLYDNVESTQHLQFLVNEEFIKIISGPGLVVLKNEDEPLEEGRVTFDKRVYVPFHMITYLELDVQHMQEKPRSTVDLLVPPPVVPPEPVPEQVN
jgi:hypothetical protein